MQIQHTFNNLGRNQLSDTCKDNLSRQLTKSPKSPDNRKAKLKTKQKQITLTPIDANQTLIAESFRLQCEEKFEESVEKLEKASANLFEMIGKLQGSSDFYMKVMPAMREERQLIPEKIIDEFWSHNEVLLNQNFEQNAYYLLLTRELEEKKEEKQWSQEDEELLNHLCDKGESIDVIIGKLAHKSPKEVTARVCKWQPRH